MKAIQKSLLALALAGAFTSANATPVDWTLTNFTLSTTSPTGASFEKYFTGSFTYDADNNTYSNFNVSFSCPGCASSSYSMGFTNGDANSFTMTQVNNSFGVGVFSFLSPLTNAGGSVQLSSNVPDWGGSASATVSGSLTGVPQTPKATAVPEPEAYAMMLAGLGLVGFAARRKLG